MERSYYSDSIADFKTKSKDQIFSILSQKNEFSLEQTQRDAWIAEIEIMKTALKGYDGAIYFEYSIPRMGKRVDVVLLIEAVIFVLEFKVGSSDFSSYAIDQVWDYALDLKNFHETSHEHYIAPILISTLANDSGISISFTPKDDKLIDPIRTNTGNLGNIIENVLKFSEGQSIQKELWEAGRYCPTPTIIEAAMSLYNCHSVENIARSDASAKNLRETSTSVSEIINFSKENSRKSICFVTGVPGAGKTLVGLNIATQHIDKDNELYSVFLSGNGPLVKILCEALARDKVQRAKERDEKIKKGEALSEVKMFIQNVHHFRDDCLVDEDTPPIEHVALFDEAQRAWDIKQTSDFMKRKKNKPGFDISEPEFLISCLDRHKDWAVIVCLVGGGQEINIGEAGITEWVDSLQRSYKHWDIYISPRLTDSEYGAGHVLENLDSSQKIEYDENLHLAVSMRSFRAENVSLFVKQLLDLETDQAKGTLEKIKNKFPIVLTRCFKKAKQWVKEKARGSERYGLIVSSRAERLKPYAIDVKSPLNPVYWFLNDKDDIRSSYFLESAASEFDVQGLELDWACVAWDADFRYTHNGWDNCEFRGSKWNKIRKEERKIYQKNAYRVLLTRARQGMVIVVPDGNVEDHTRPPEFYDSTFEYLKSIGIQEI